MATTSAIALIGETLTQASKTATAAAELTNATVARDEVLADRKLMNRFSKYIAASFGCKNRIKSGC